MRIVVTLIWIAALWLLAVGRPILAHELPPTEVEVQFQGDELTLIIPLAFEELIADMMVQMDPNADTMAVADQFDQLLTSDANALIEAFAPYADPFIHDFVILSGNQRFQADIIDYQIPVPNADATPRRSVIIAQTRIPSNIDAVQIGWGAENGDLAISYPPTGQFDYLVQGALSNPIALRDPSGSARLDAWQFIYSGFVHIIPRGTDHIIFILGLFFYSLSFLSLVKQATVFTVAHSITLLLASIGVINISPSIVEPLIALSIVFIGIENLRPKSRGTISLRYAVIFVFGLIHGLGFASVMAAINANFGNPVLEVLYFNIGVEIGQIAVLALAFALIALPFGKKPYYHKWIAVPASLGIAAFGAVWFIARII